MAELLIVEFDQASAPIGPSFGDIRLALDAHIGYANFGLWCNPLTSCEAVIAAINAESLNGRNLASIWVAPEKAPPKNGRGCIQYQRTRNAEIS